MFKFDIIFVLKKQFITDYRKSFDVTDDTLLGLTAGVYWIKMKLKRIYAYPDITPLVEGESKKGSKAHLPGPAINPLQSAQIFDSDLRKLRIL